ncbi:MAG: hypothetical protein HPY71_11840 [Firmicutes bacterium]|nr:hypothetical protein [Bacillota bacterium]
MTTGKRVASIQGFLGRFTVVHVLTYLVFGLFFMVITRYFEYFASDPLLREIMRPQDSAIVRLAVVFQILRGALLGLAFYPFRGVILEPPYGWLKLFMALWILTWIGAVVTGPGSIEGYIYTKFRFDIAVGLPEITTQMLVFSYLFVRWEQRYSSMT